MQWWAHIFPINGVTSGRMFNLLYLKAFPAPRPAPGRFPSAGKTVSLAGPRASLHPFALAALLYLTMPTGHAEATNRVFVTNEQSDSVSVIDSRTFEVIATIDVGDRPQGIGLSPDGSRLYVAVSNEDLIKVIDPETLEIVDQFTIDFDSEVFGVHPEGNIFMPNEDRAMTSVINPATGRKLAEIDVGLEPEGVAVSPDGKYVIITSESSNKLHVIQVPEHVVVKEIAVGARPRAATFSRDGRLVYASSEISGEIQKISTKDFTIIGKTRINDPDAKPKDVLLGRDEELLYVAGGRANAVFVLNADSLEQLKRIPVGERTWGLAMTRDKKRLFTTDGVSGTVSVIDTVNNELIETIKVGEYPWSLVVDD